jgi:ABC-type nitrate/sulfonate/bicarbonate transport system substrate-binding protein
LNYFSKYRLDVDFVFIPGGARGMQALVGGSTQSADSDGVAPIHVMHRGGDAVIVAGLNNKPLFNSLLKKKSPSLRNCARKESASPISADPLSLPSRLH